MGDFGAFKKTPSAGKGLNRADDLMAYEKSYMDLLKRYKDEIQWIEDMLCDLRKEKTQFYKEQLPEIQKELEMDEVSSEIRSQWLNEIQKNVEKSFEISQRLIEHYITKNLDEFKHALQQEMV